MPSSRTLILLGLLAALVGCTRDQIRREHARGSMPSPLAREYARGPIAAPQPPTPPPLPSPPREPSVSPPRADALASTAPDRPTGHGPTLDPEVTPASGDQFISTAEDKKRLRERLEELRKRMEERRDERRDSRTKPDPKSELPSPVESKDKKTDPKPDSPSRTDEKSTPTPLPPTRPNNGTSPEDLATVKRLNEEFKKRFSSLDDFEARLIKREVVNGKETSQDEILYRYRVKPQSVYMRTLSEAGQGREVLYIAGQKNMTVITGKGDNPIVGVGYKTDLDPDSKLATSRSRHKIYEAGFTRSEKGLTRAIEAAEKGNPIVIKSLGAIKRKEYDYPLLGVALELKPGQDPSMPKGGRREIYFDSKVDSPSYMLPVVALAHEPDGREVEYYAFDRFKVPANFDWNPDSLGRKR